MHSSAGRRVSRVRRQMPPAAAHGARAACPRNRPEALRRIAAAGACELFREKPRATAAGFAARQGRARLARVFART
eukprot:9171677-Pyramimonas_sp.AAC.1